jgi:hypothetical protein
MRVEIILDKWGSAQRVLIDRVEISRIVTDLVVTAEANTVPKLQLTLIPDQIIIDADIPQPVARVRERLLAGGETQPPLPFAADRG